LPTVRSGAKIPLAPVPQLIFDATTSGADHMIQGLGVVNCTASPCQMSVGYISSANGGSAWSAAQTIGGPMTMAQIANTSQGTMVGDYSPGKEAGTAFASPLTFESRRRFTVDT
jgi:hypothetical protein